MSRILSAQRAIFANELALMFVHNKLLVVPEKGATEDGEVMVLLSQALRRYGINMRCLHHGPCFSIIFEDITRDTKRELVVATSNDNNRHVLVGENGELVAYASPIVDLSDIDDIPIDQF
jgi:hypothetical protein